MKAMWSSIGGLCVLRVFGVGSSESRMPLLVLVLHLQRATHIQILSWRTDLDQGTFQCVNAHTLL